jgi:hypothetical protein
MQKRGREEKTERKKGIEVLRWSVLWGMCPQGATLHAASGQTLSLLLQKTLHFWWVDTARSFWDALYWCLHLGRRKRRKARRKPVFLLAGFTILTAMVQTMNRRISNSLCSTRKKP